MIAPQLGEAVLDRRAGERDADGRGAARARPGLLGLGVLDVLRLVEDHAAPLHRFATASRRRGQQAVGGDDEVVVLHLRGEGRGLDALDAARAVMDEHAQARGEARRLVPPVADDGGGADQQDGPCQRPLPSGAGS